MTREEWDGEEYNQTKICPVTGLVCIDCTRKDCER